MNNTPVFGEPPAGISCVERPAAYVCVFDGAGRVAVVLFNGRYFLPGGGSDPGETPEETIHREIREELACEIHLVRSLGTAIQYFPADGVYYRMTASFYLGEFTSEPDGIGEHELSWVPISEIEEGFRHACQIWAVQIACVGTTDL